MKAKKQAESKLQQSIAKDVLTVEDDEFDFDGAACANSNDCRVGTDLKSLGDVKLGILEFANSSH